MGHYVQNILNVVHGQVKKKPLTSDIRQRSPTAFITIPLHYVGDMLLSPIRYHY